MSTFKFLPEGWNDENIIFKFESKEELIKTDDILQGVVEDCDDQFNLHVNLKNNMKGIIPINEVEEINLEENGLPKSNLCTGKVHKYVQFKVKGTDGEQLVLSRKDAQREVLNYIKTDLKEGQKIKGIVKNIRPYGAFIEIGGGVVGLVHIEDLSVARIKTPLERLKIGQKIDIVVKSIDRNTGKVTLSYKECYGTWDENAQKFKTGMKTRGIVRETEKNRNGIFIELLPNLVGMMEYKEGLKYGQNINVMIKKIDYDRKKIKLAYY